MVATIPNDIFQFSTHTAHTTGFTIGQPRTCDLTTHGTYGIGTYEDSSLLLLKDKRAFSICPKTGLSKPAPSDSRLPFAMVTVYEPTFRVKISSATLESLEELFSSSDFGPAKSVNTLTPFKLSGRFASVSFEHAAPSLGYFDGMLFGYVVPVWMKGICGPRIHAHLLDANEEVGGKVSDFSMDEDAVLSFAKCGRFHLGFPGGEEWENMKL